MTHPDNILGAAVLLAGLAIPDNEPDLYRDWFFNRMIPAAVESGHFEPILFNEPAIGSGILMLAAATQYPPWAVKYGVQ